jgi:hypothetical protein
MEPTNSGFVSVVGREAKGGKLYIDGKLACSAPCRTEVPPGKRKIVVEKDGKEDYAAELEVGRTTETTIDIQFSDKPPITRAVTSAVIAAAILAGGFYVGGLAKANKDGLNADIAAGLHVDNDDPRFLRGKLEAIGADVLFGLGAIVGITAIAGFFAHGPDSTGAVDQKSLGFTPTVGAGGGGVSAFGRF